MGAIKRFAEEVSDVMGRDGEIDQEVCDVANIVMGKIEKSGLQREEFVAENPKFRALVMEVIAQRAEKLL